MLLAIFYVAILILWAGSIVGVVYEFLEKDISVGFWPFISTMVFPINTFVWLYMRDKRLGQLSIVKAFNDLMKLIKEINS